MNFKQFDTIIDVRSPAEYAEDHIPGAISAPVLDDAERAEADTLEGGYKAYRRWVIQQLEGIPERLDLRVIHGPTGSGKSRLLAALKRAGAQAVDLEDLAAHRGSVLGNLPDRLQPSQKMFESLLLKE